MKLQVCVFILCASLVFCLPAEEKHKLEEKKQSKRGLLGLSDHGLLSHDWHLNGALESAHLSDAHLDGAHLSGAHLSGAHFGPGHEEVKTITIEKEVKVPILKPYPVHIEKKIPVPVKVPVPVSVDKPYPVPVVKHVPYLVDKPVPYPVEKPIPYPVKVPVKVPVPHPYPVLVKKPVPILLKSHGHGHDLFEHSGLDLSHTLHSHDAHSYANLIQH